MAILNAWAKGKKFDPKDILALFIEWKKGIPKDIGTYLKLELTNFQGMTTAIVLQNAFSKVKTDPEDWSGAAKDFYATSPNMAANGAHFHR